MAVSQSLYLTQESQSVVSNSSKVRILWQSKQTGNSHNLNQRTAYYYVSVNGGAEVEYSVQYKLPLNTLQTIVDVIIEVPHTEDGKGAVSVRTWMNTQISAGVVQLEKALTLAQIARASAIGATDADIEATSSIIVTQRSSAYTHSIYFEFGELAGYVLADGSISVDETRISATNIAFGIPSTFYDQIPDSVSGICKLTCRTYLGTVQIGQAQTATFTVTANRAKCSPNVQYSIEDVNATTLALTGDSSKLIQYMSIARCTIHAVARNGAYIVSKSIADVEVVNDSREIASIESGSISFVATDSRGYSTRLTVHRDLIAYVKLTANVQLMRNDPTSGKATLSIRGDYFNGSFGAELNSLRIQYRLTKVGAEYGDYAMLEPVIDNNTYSTTIALAGLDYEYAYDAQVVVEDALSSTVRVATVSQGIPVFDWGERDFRFNVPVMLPKSCYGDTLPFNGKQGQIFLQKNVDTDGYTIRVHNGTSWQ